MKGLFTFVFLLAMLIDPTKIGKINALKSEAKKAYLAGDYKTAIEKYRYLVDSLHVQEDEVVLNLANSYFQLNDTTNAVNQYQTITQSPKSQLRSKAEQQLGVMANRQGKSEEALSHFKQAIKSDQTNEDARYNYELLKKKLEEEKKKQEQKQDQNKDQKDQENKDQEKKDQQDKQDQKKDQKDKEEQKKDQQQKDEEQKDSEQKKKEEQESKDQKENQEKKDIPPSVKEKLKQMQMSEQKAKMILEAMKNQEIQYLQQNKRKATKPKDRGKPDW
jgi:hypothetical protein